MIEPLTPINNLSSSPTVKRAAIDQLVVASCTLADLFHAHHTPIPGTNIQGPVNIPEYQRSYVWKERQINKLLNDLLAHDKNPKSKPLYYLGSIILHDDGKHLNIIDGQQRLTTMLILNSFLSQRVSSTIRYQSPETFENIRFVHSYLKAIANQEIPEFTDLNFSQFISFSHINVTLIITNSEDLAYTFFETQNTGGVRLGGTDIAKAHHLRAIDDKKMIAHQARRWESRATEEIEHCIKNLIKIRYWNSINWQAFPFKRNDREIKETIIDEFTERTVRQREDISLYYTAEKQQMHGHSLIKESPYRQIRQPLYDGINFLNYIHEYVALQEVLFKSDTDRLSSFINFRKMLLHGQDGTILLKEFFEVILLTYVSRFGFNRLFEVSLWLYRYVYSQRVSVERNILESSVFKFAFDHKIIDKILYSYTTDEVLDELKRFRYSFKDKNLEDHHAKGKHVLSVKSYFMESGIHSFTTAEEMQKDNAFDRALINGINTVLSQHNNNDRVEHI